ncbi:DUF2283 domain-containing protein [Larkinella terrae]|uniref:DUF2283 domain-containing protein n=1 Tax=Larkinella terrae TaxID=2025311 RepID=A0A7K0EM51_9BACT|nr:DUF2283 domain-containing protein [Larkinella terrae]MRS62930.1 DUF2283 domain-containing protein [Larkinella terrae]
MEKVSVFYDTEGNTLTVWFGNREDEVISEETGEEMVLMKNSRGEVIGFEKLNFRTNEQKGMPIGFEAITV